MRQMKKRLIMLLLILALMVLHIAAAVPSEETSVKAETEAAEEKAEKTDKSSAEEDAAQKQETGKTDAQGAQEKETGEADAQDRSGDSDPSPEKEKDAEVKKEDVKTEAKPESAGEAAVNEDLPAEAVKEDTVQDASGKETESEENPAKESAETAVQEPASGKETGSEEKTEESPAEEAQETAAQEPAPAQETKTEEAAAEELRENTQQKQTVTTPAENADKEIWIDNSVDRSVTYIYSCIRVIDEATGRWIDISINLTNEIAVTFSNPRPQAVEDAINEVKNSLEETAKSRGYTNYTITEDTPTEKTWDNRTYTVFDRGDAEVIGDPGFLPVDPYGDLTKVYIVDGDYGRKTTYTIYLTETVNLLYDITVNTYGKGTVTVDPESAAEDTRVSVNYKADQGYMISSVLVRNDSVDGSDGQISAVVYGDSGQTEDSISFTMPASNVTVSVDFVEIPHEHELVKTDKVEATCEKEGTEAYWTCSVCGKMFSDEEGTTEIEEPVKISATGHNWGEWVVTKKATEDKAGEETRTCKNDPSHKETRTIPALEKEQEEEKEEEKTEENKTDSVVDDTEEKEVVAPADDTDDSDSSDDDSSSSGKSSSKSSSEAKSPKTGDRGDVYFRTLLALAAIAAISAVVLAGRGRKRS